MHRSNFERPLLGKEETSMAVKATVQQVLKGKHGSYAVATLDEPLDGVRGSVTITLDRKTWLESNFPVGGSSILVADLQKKRKGWRAGFARLFRACDARSNQQSYQFQYPTSRQFPFDEVCERIVRELEARNWQVPGIEVEFWSTGHGDGKYKHVWNVTGEDFQLHYSRPQGRIPDSEYNNCAAVSTLTIPKMELTVYDREDGPTLAVYAGISWKKDRERFRRESKTHMKLDKRMRVLLYRGSWTNDSRVRYTNAGRAPYLVPESDHREYQPTFGEPKSYRTSEVFDTFTRWLEDVLLPRILAHPEAAEPLPAEVEEVVPFPTDFPLFVACEWRDAERIQRGQTDRQILLPDDRYSLYGGMRVLPLGFPNDGTVNEKAYDGGVWCGIGEVDDQTDVEKLRIGWSSALHHRDSYLVRVIPNRANDVYILDTAADKSYCEAIFAQDPSRRLSNEEARHRQILVARSLVPIAEYKGGYTSPVTIVMRELDLNEVEIVSGPHKPY